MSTALKNLREASGRYVRITGGYHARGKPMIKLATARKLIYDGKAVDQNGKLHYVGRER